MPTSQTKSGVATIGTKTFKTLEIPDYGTFCILEDSVGGITEKLSLIPLDKAKAELKRTPSVKLKPAAILKLPKHGKEDEVLREFVALGISESLGFTTTKRQFVMHEGKAALFVPFDTIKLMDDYAVGETQRMFVPSSLKRIPTILDTYLHHSTIKPVGNGLHADSLLDDFGKTMAFFYLCNDTDFMGGYNQNKAIKEGKALYIFDQIFSGKDKMEFDTRLSLVPFGFGRHFRHNQGRNRSIIEDSSFEKKFQGVVALLNHKQAILDFLDKLPEQERFGKTIATIKDKINQRMNTLFKRFPRLLGEKISAKHFLDKDQQDLIKHSLMLEKLVNHPVLFSADGRPYKFPWTNRHTNTIKDISMEGDMVVLTFDKLGLDLDGLRDILKAASINTDHCSFNGPKKTIKIPLNELKKINESCMAREHADLDTTHDYLSNVSISVLKKSYPKDDFKKIEPLLFKCRLEIDKANPPSTALEKANVILTALDRVQSHQKTKDLGLSNGSLKSIELKLHMELQKRLRILFPEHDLNSAFEAAKKLDLVDDFHQGLMTFANAKTPDPTALKAYLDQYILHADAATTYDECKTESETLKSWPPSINTSLPSQTEATKDESEREGESGSQGPGLSTPHD